ncbi:DUF4157 domain-containing protein [Chitinophagaceae bacterium 26-R-25]|nr:DUF4157 domain-containing protein [Chitinophagaceae bacterium 26-R-25]
MKTAEAKPAAKQAAKSSQPFFNKAGQGFFANESANDSQSFFSSQKNSLLGTRNGAIQTKTTIGEPNDKYEHEADAMADKVVQRLTQNKTNEKLKNGTVNQPKPFTPVTIASAPAQNVQAKCASCEQEEKLQKKEEEIEEKGVAKDKLQKKPMFEGNPEPPDDKNNIQRKCAECEKEEKLQKKDDEKKDEKELLNGKVQRKPIFESNAEPLERNIQRKFDKDEKEGKLQKKDTDKKEEKDLQNGKLQRKPMFERSVDQSKENIQRNAAESEKEKNKKLQTKSEAASTQTASSAIESSLSSSKGGGNPLPEGTRTEMENSFGSDFSNVRVHNDSTAVQMSKDLSAQAFTHGNDIYFNSGKYDPKSTAGKHLLAHELTHTIQQGGGVSRMLQRVPDPSQNNSSESIDFTNKVINIPVINIPQAKQRDDSNLIAPPLVYPEGYKRKNSYKDKEDESSSNPQREVWKQAVEGDVKSKVNTKADEAKAKNAFDKNTESIYLKHKTNKKNLKLIGKAETITASSIIPNWSRAGKASAFDVDHVKELQLGGANYATNMELLDFSHNRAAGNAVKNEIDGKILNYLESEKKKNSKDFNNSAFPVNTDKAKEKFSIAFGKPAFTIDPKASGNDHYWSLASIKKGEQLDGFEPMRSEEIKAAQGEKGKELIYTSPSGGAAITKNDFKKFNQGKNVALSEPVFLDQTGKAPGAEVGSFNAEFDFYGSGQEKKKFRIPIFQMEGVLFGGHIPRRGQKGSGGLEQILVGIRFPGMSPVIVEQADLLPEKGLQVRGKIKPTLKIIEGIDVDFYIDGDNFGLSKTFSAGEINVPPPFKINDASITVFAGTDGFGVRGDVLFEIAKIGSGKISGTAKTDGKFGIVGRFDFDKKLFTGGASVTVEYDSEKLWKIHGELGIAKGSVKGIKSGKIIVDYADNKLTAEGTAIPELKAVKEVTLKIEMTKEQFMIEGGIKLNKLPGIKSGEGTLTVIKTGDEYDFSGKGKILPDIPGVTAELDFSFHNEIFDVNSTVAFEKGRLKANMKVGITNTEVSADGKPTGKATETFRVYGGGDAQLKITEKLIATAGVKFLENGEIEVKGGIKLPDKFEVVPSLLSIKDKPIVPFPKISIPLFGIPLGVTTIGLEATIQPKLLANVQIGPGSFTNVQAEITYNPSKPDDMTITGGADFEFIAEAGITAGVDFGIGVSAGVASVTGGVNLSAFIKAAAKQPVFHAELKYSPKTGFEMKGNVQAIVKAILGFSGSLFLEAKVDVLLFSASKRFDKELFKKEIDTGLDIGFEFPFSYSNGQANLSFDNLKFTYPKFDETFLNNIKKQMLDPVKDQVLGKK